MIKEITIGKNIKKYRKKLELLREDFAKKI